MSQQPYGQQYPPQPPLPSPPTKTKKWPWIVGGVVTLIVIGSIANGGKDTAPAGSTTTVTVAAQPTTTVQPAPTTAVIAQPAPSTQAAAAPKMCTVPDVVGLVHQTAQDTMQASGLYMLTEEDATGKGRMLVMDRNWTTTAQSVPAGQVVDCNTSIKLSAKKIGE